MTARPQLPLIEVAPALDFASKAALELYNCFAVAKASDLHGHAAALRILDRAIELAKAQG